MSNEQLIDECENMRFASNVYFMKPVGMDGPIKIGVSTLPATRLITVMTWSPFPLEVLAFGRGNKKLEQFLHRKFRAQRSHLEWFHPCPEMLDGISRVKAGECVEKAFGAQYHVHIPKSRFPQAPFMVMRYRPEVEIRAFMMSKRRAAKELAA